MVFEGQCGWLLGDPVAGRFQVHATDDGGRSWRLLPDGPRAEAGEAAFAASGTCIARAGAALAVATGGSRSAVHFRRDGAGQWRRVASGFDAGTESKGVFSLADTGSGGLVAVGGDFRRSEEHTSELQSLMRISYAVFCLKTKKLKTLH